MSKKVISTKRKDKKGRILRDGECQRKDGQYQYNYTDVDGKRKCVYSWKLEKTDALPKGKRDCDSLREKEQEIQCKKNDGINTDGGKITVFEQAKKYVSLKIGVRNSTKRVTKLFSISLKRMSLAHGELTRLSLLTLSSGLKSCRKKAERVTARCIL